MIAVVPTSWGECKKVLIWMPCRYWGTAGVSIRKEAMKAYLLGYKLDVEFGDQPGSDSRYANRELAEGDCRILNRFSLRVANHQCSFAVDALPEGGFGIICICHPMLHPGPAPAVLRRASDLSKTA